MMEAESTVQARAQFDRCNWSAAGAVYRAVDLHTPLDGESLQRLATCAYMLGDTETFLTDMARAYQLFVATSASLRAVRCAFWISLTLALRGDVAKAGGWGSRASRLLEQEAEHGVEGGYWLLPEVERALGSGRIDDAAGHARKAAAIGVAHSDVDLVALASHLEGRIEIERGNVATGLALLDEAMLSVTSDELSPIVTGLIYCNVLEGCQQVFAIERAREWTTALSQWCAKQPTMIAFTGKCLVHRAEVMCIRGDWSAAATEASQAHARLSARGDSAAEGAAVYQQAELYRLVGEHSAAERAYETASRLGRDPQPGLALLRLDQGEIDKAVAGVERVLASPEISLSSARPLEACTEVMLAAGRVDQARRAAQQLALVAETYGTRALTAMSEAARGAVLVSAGDAHLAIGPLREALQIWQATDAPHAAAKVRVWLGRAYQTLGDDEARAMEWDAARASLEQLGALPDLRRLAALGQSGTRSVAGLTAREHEVLRLVAAGKTNKEIATVLDLSVRTVDRHLSNIFTKIGATTRSAATAFAYENDLV